VLRAKAAPAPVRTARADPPTVAVHREPAPRADTPAVAVHRESASPAAAAARTPEPEPLAPPVHASSRLAALEAAVETVADPVRARPAAASPAGKPELVRLGDAAKPQPRKKPEPRKPELKPEPSRAWVQIAVAGERAALPGEFARLKAKAPKLLAARAAWTAPLGATNRLLVGPFPSSRDAQAFVKDLDRADLGGFAWTSDEGEKVQKLTGK
ncbi:MAG: SPOR domain-containing protein, partial [Allosphingosinicella sp.]